MSILMWRSFDFDVSEFLELGLRICCNYVYNVGWWVVFYICFYIFDEGNCFGINCVLKFFNFCLLKSVFLELGIRSLLGIVISSIYFFGG